MSFTAFIPCASDDWQFPNRNTRPFASSDQGLIGFKLRQLAYERRLSSIIVSTNDPKVIAIAEHFRREDPRIRVDIRPDALCQPTTSTSALCRHLTTLVDTGHVLWTHVTNPLVDEFHYRKMLTEYLSRISGGEYDSLMSVTRIQSYLWNEDGRPANYETGDDKWPRTRLIRPLFNVNSAAFVADISVIRECDDRIGRRPFLYELDEIAALKIDTEMQFKIADYIHTFNDTIARAAYA